MKISRTAEFVLGLIGGICGIIAGIVAIAIGGVGSAVGASQAGSVTSLGIFAILFSILGIVGAAIVNSKTKVSGILMVIACVGGFVCISMVYIFPGIMFAIAGVMALVRKDKSLEESAQTIDSQK